MTADKRRCQTQSSQKPAPAKNNLHNLPDNLPPTIPESAFVCVHLRLKFFFPPWLNKRSMTNEA
jgi:hypothetical protein